MLEIEILTNKQVVYAQNRIHFEEWNTQTSLGFWDENELPNLGQTTLSSDSQKKKKKKEKTAE